MIYFRQKHTPRHSNSKEENSMKRHNLIRRLTAALVAGAMALSLCAPALAAADEPAAALQPGT